MDKKTFDLRLENNVKEIEGILEKYLPEISGMQKTVIDAMHYSVMVGGKRLRPMLMKETYMMFGGSGREIEPFMAAVEMIHTYSLVHDDLPAMDNDEYRRGHKTTWYKYGDAMGVLAGDALLNYAFETALKAFNMVDNDRYSNVIQALNILFNKSGIYGMIGGQTADIEAEGCKEPVPLNKLLFIHEYKTAALIQASMMVGACLAGASWDDIDRISRCAYNVGIAFQIQDDILDVTGSLEELGKMTGSDAQNEKQTYATIKGLEEAARDVEALSKDAVNLLDEIGMDADFIKELILKLISRRK